MLGRAGIACDQPARFQTFGDARRGGEIARDKSGEPTGLLFERAMSAVETASRAGAETRFVSVAAAGDSMLSPTVTRQLIAHVAAAGLADLAIVEGRFDDECARSSSGETRASSGLSPRCTTPSST